MLNNVIVVGRVKCFENIEPNATKIQIAVPRAFKNTDGEYDTDRLDVVLTGMLKDNAKDYLKVNDLVGIKGRLANKDGLEKLHIVAEKLTFLSSNKEEEGSGYSE